MDYVPPGYDPYSTWLQCGVQVLIIDYQPRRKTVFRYRKNSLVGYNGIGLPVEHFGSKNIPRTRLQLTRKLLQIVLTQLIVPFITNQIYHPSLVFVYKLSYNIKFLSHFFFCIILFMSNLDFIIKFKLERHLTG